MSTGFAELNAAGKAAFLVIDSGTNDVDVYTRDGTLIATITGFTQPQALAAGPTGNVYVADTGTAHILVYENDYKTLKATLTDPGQYPVDVAIDATTGTVGVTNIISTTGGPGSVSFYPKGATKACVTVADSALSRIYFGAFDDTGDFYIDGTNESGAVVVGVVKGGCSAHAITTLRTANTIGFPGGIQVSPTDKIVIDDQAGAKLYTYNVPVKNVLGKPITTTPLTNAQDPVSFAFNKAGTDLWIAQGAVLEYAYPAGGLPIGSIKGVTGAAAVAVTPSEEP